MYIVEKIIYISRYISTRYIMTTREKVKKEIDKMPNDTLEKVYKYINSLRTKAIHKNRIHTFNLKGQLDNVNIRKKAYE